MKNTKLKSFPPSLLLLLCLLGKIIAAPLNPAPFPTPPDKKGLQVQMVDDALALGVHHAAINVSLGSLFQTKAEKGTAFTFEGHTYYINEGYAQSLDKQIKPLSDAKVVVYLIMLAYPTKNPEKDKLLLHPTAKADGKYNIAAFNTATPEGLQLYRALFGFLAQRYNQPSSPHGQVWGWIIGNEVNSQWMWYNCGKQPLKAAVAMYEQAFRAAYEVVSTIAPNSRLYVSFDHHWTAAMPGISDQESYPGRAYLDEFAAQVKQKGDFPWHLAHHPYPDDLGNPRTWLDKAATKDENSPHITFKNLEVACRYMLRPDMLWKGQPRRIILSEQGIHCLATPDGESLQAAGFAYAWEKTRQMPGIDALIWHRHVDHAHEGGLRLGLWTFKPGTVSTPDRHRQFYDLFQKAGTPAWPEAAAFALPIAGLKSWGELGK